MRGVFCCSVFRECRKGLVTLVLASGAGAAAAGAAPLATVIIVGQGASTAVQWTIGNQLKNDGL